MKRRPLPRNDLAAALTPAQGVTRDDVREQYRIVMRIQQTHPQEAESLCRIAKNMKRTLEIERERGR